MNKKGKILSVVAVMALVLSLVAVIPAALVGAATTGTVQLNRSVYSLQAETGVDGFSATSAFNVVKVRVTDADVNVERTATAYYAFHPASIESANQSRST